MSETINITADGMFSVDGGDAVKGADIIARMGEKAPDAYDMTALSAASGMTADALQKDANYATYAEAFKAAGISQAKFDAIMTPVAKAAAATAEKYGKELQAAGVDTAKINNQINAVLGITDTDKQISFDGADVAALKALGDLAAKAGGGKLPSPSSPPAGSVSDIKVKIGEKEYGYTPGDKESFRAFATQTIEQKDMRGNMVRRPIGEVSSDAARIIAEGYNIHGQHMRLLAEAAAKAANPAA